MQMYPFVRAAVERPWYYYLVTLASIVPLVLVIAWAVARDHNAWRTITGQVVLAWFCVILITLTTMGINGYGFQMRHIAPAMPAIYVMVLVLLLTADRPLLLMACGFATIVGTVEKAGARS